MKFSSPWDSERNGKINARVRQTSPLFLWLIPVLLLCSIACGTGSASVTDNPAELEKYGGQWLISELNSQEQLGEFAIWTGGKVIAEGKLFDKVFSGCQNPLGWQPRNDDRGFELFCDDRRVQLKVEAGGRIRFIDQQTGDLQGSKYFSERKMTYQQLSDIAKLDSFQYIDPEMPQCFPAQNVNGRDMRASTMARSNNNCSPRQPDPSINRYFLDCETRSFGYIGDAQTCASTVTLFDENLRKLNQNVTKRWNGKWSIMGRPDAQLITRSARGKLEAVFPLSKKKTFAVSMTYNPETNYFEGKATEKFNGDVIERHVVLRFVEENLIVYDTEVIAGGQVSKFQSPPYLLEQRAKRVK